MAQYTLPHQSIRRRMAASLVVALLSATFALGQDDLGQDEQLWKPPPIETNAGDSELVKLRKEKVNFATTTMSFSRYVTRRVYPSLSSVNQLRQAEIELATSKQEKLLALEREAARLQAIEKITHQAVAGGASSGLELHDVAIASLGNQIAQHILQNDERPEAPSAKTKSLFAARAAELGAKMDIAQLLHAGGHAPSFRPPTPLPSDLEPASQLQLLEQGRTHLVQEVNHHKLMREKSIETYGKAADHGMNADEEWSHLELAVCEWQLLRLDPSRRDIPRGKDELRAEVQSRSRLAWDKYKQRFIEGAYSGSDLITRHAQIASLAATLDASPAEQLDAAQGSLQALADIDVKARAEGGSLNAFDAAVINLARVSAQIRIIELKTILENPAARHTDTSTPPTASPSSNTCPTCCSQSKVRCRRLFRFTRR